jgi:hypothetical protein
MNRRVLAPVLFVVTILLAGVAGWMINDQSEPPALVTLSPVEVTLQQEGYEPTHIVRQIHHETLRPTQNIMWSKPGSDIEINVVDGEITLFGTDTDWCIIERELPLEDLLMVGNRAVNKAQLVWKSYGHRPEAPEYRSWDNVRVPLNDTVDEQAQCVHQHEIP